MTGISVKTQDFKDRANPPWPELAEDIKSGKKVVKYAIASKCSILEAGTANGRTSVQIIAETKDGEVLVIETTARTIVNGIVPIIKGSAERWGDNLEEV